MTLIEEGLSAPVTTVIHPDQNTKHVIGRADSGKEEGKWKPEKIVDVMIW